MFRRSVSTPPTPPTVNEQAMSAMVSVAVTAPSPDDLAVGLTIAEVDRVEELLRFSGDAVTTWISPQGVAESLAQQHQLIRALRQRQGAAYATSGFVPMHLAEIDIVSRSVDMLEWAQRKGHASATVWIDIGRALVRDLDIRKGNAQAVMYLARISALPGTP